MVLLVFLICVLEVADAFADALADFGQAIGPEDQDDDHKDDEQLRKADAAHNVTSGVSCPGKAQFYHAGATGMAFEQVASEVVSMRRLMVAASVALAGGVVRDCRGAAGRAPRAVFVAGAARRGLRHRDRRQGRARHRSTSNRLRGVRERSAPRIPHSPPASFR